MTNHIKQDAKHYLGHRKRVKEKFLKNNGQSMANYELLELILFYAVPRRDVKPLAKTLLANFKSLANLLNADAKDILSIPGTNESVAILLKVAAKLTHSSLYEDISKRNILNSWDSLLTYCSSQFSHCEIELCRILFLDSGYYLLNETLSYTGTTNEVTIYNREILRGAIKSNASHVILIHNHPNGVCEPSTDDLKITTKLSASLENIEINLLDHIIFTRNNVYSFRNTGLLQ